MQKLKIIALSGSSRKASWNQKLVRVAMAAAVREGADVQYIDLADYEMPVYNGDFEEKNGVPKEADALAVLFSQCDGILISSPEHNGAFPALVKNTLDWISRSEFEGEPFANKPIMIMSASPGAMGGYRGLVLLRAFLGNLNFMVLPGQVALGKCHEAFLENGSLKDAKQLAAIEKLGTDLVRFVGRLKNQ